MEDISSWTIDMIKVRITARPPVTGSAMPHKPGLQLPTRGQGGNYKEEV